MSRKCPQCGKGVEHNGGRVPAHKTGGAWCKGAGERLVEGRCRVIAAAIRHDGWIYFAPRPARHPDVMAGSGQRTMLDGGVKWKLFDGEQGFIDQWGRFLTREAAYVVARDAGQLVARAGGYRKGEVTSGPQLFSEDVW